MKSRCYFATAAIVLSLAASAAAALPEPVKTDSGLVSGVPATTDAVRVFKGIPFAAPPVGPLRWRAPQPPAKWEGVRKADQFGARCMQGGGGGGRQGGPPPQPISEDCLYLNVWTPAAAASDRLPVIVWSYGGAFTGGAGSLPQYDGEQLARKGVIFVTYNYRLGPFGFFAHPELSKESGHRASGNYGMMDLVAALQWVQNNIAAFGGDPSRVTLMGESAGGALIETVVASPHGKGLFRRAISQSAPVRIERLATLEEAEQSGRQAAEKIGAKSLADLRMKSAEEIQKGVPGGRPIVDGWYLPDDVSTLIAEGKSNDVDVLVGSNRDEGAFPFFGVPRGTAQEYTASVRQRFGAQADGFLKLYPTGSEAESNASQLAAFRDEVAWNVRSWAAARARKGKAYLFYFTHEPPAAAGQPSRGAIHTAEIPYTLNNATPSWTAADRALAETMTSYWVNFAKSGDPNGPGLPVWPAFKDGASAELMIFGPKVEAGRALDPARVALFDAYSKTQGR
jgi:para-nitrobenzyl esterase